MITFSPFSPKPDLPIPAGAWSVSEIGIGEFQLLARPGGPVGGKCLLLGS